MADYETMEAMKNFCSGSPDGMLNVLPASAEFSHLKPQVLPMSVANFGSEFSEFHAWNGQTINADHLFASEGIPGVAFSENLENSSPVETVKSHPPSIRTARKSGPGYV